MVFHNVRTSTYVCTYVARKYVVLFDDCLYEIMYLKAYKKLLFQSALCTCFPIGQFETQHPVYINGRFTPNFLQGN